MLLLCLVVYVCVCVSYHFWGHPGNQIMDSLPQDAQRGENKHNPEDHTRSADTKKEKQRVGSQRRPLRWPHHEEPDQSVQPKQDDLKRSHTSSIFKFLSAACHRSSAAAAKLKVFAVSPCERLEMIQGVALK